MSGQPHRGTTPASRPTWPTWPRKWPTPPPLAGAAKVYNAAFQQAGIVQASDLDNLFDRTLALSLQPTMKGDNLLIVTNGGGVGVLATDAAEKYGLPLKFAPEDVQAELRKHMPSFGSLPAMPPAMRACASLLNGV